MRWINNSGNAYTFPGSRSFGAHGVQALSPEDLDTLGRNAVWCQLVESGVMVCLDAVTPAAPAVAEVVSVAVSRPPEAARRPDPDVEEWGSLNAGDAILGVVETEDLATLESYQAHEGARSRPRTTVMRALANQIEQVS